jgi:hypothetical protein
MMTAKFFLLTAQFPQEREFIKVKAVKKSLFLLFVLISVLLCGCDKDDEDRITQWPSDAFDFMEGIPQFTGEQYDAAISEDYETVSIYYKDVTLDRAYWYIEELKAFGLEENVATEVKDGKYHWVSKLNEGELFAEVMWYDMDYELESGEYKYSLVIKFAEF